ncbi:hypothetical protein NN3_00020 [Nocardia neocaledoniensis NBRC 108232]|nr:hypothetical protein NN3_00020 [Nocardia neocaledoniensis NBRC 108232]
MTLVRSLWGAEHGQALGVAAIAAAASVAAIGALPAIARNRPTQLPVRFADALTDAKETGVAVLASMSDPTFYGTAVAGLLMVLGAAFAHAMWSKGIGWQGFPVACGSGLWPWIAGSGLLALALTHLLWGWTRSPAAPWQPLFVAFVSVTPAVVLMYGPGWKVALTAAVLGAGLTAPAAIAAAAYVCAPLGIPSVAGFTAAMAVTAYLAFTLCRRLPWLHRPADTDPPPPPDPVAKPPRQSVIWMLRRVLADFTEAPFLGNEWASAGLIAGAVFTYLMVRPTEGIAGIFPLILGTQLAAGALAVIVWRARWRVHGWYPTFVPLVSIAPAAVITFAASPIPTVTASVLGVLVGPPLAFHLGEAVPGHIHRFVGCVGSMAICTATIIPAVGLFA